jgi:hypothetical protein
LLVLKDLRRISAPVELKPSSGGFGIQNILIGALKAAPTRDRATGSRSAKVTETSQVPSFGPMALTGGQVISVTFHQLRYAHHEQGQGCPP